MTTKDIAELVIQKANIIDIIGEVVELKAVKGGHWGLCPFHDDNHASMSVINRDDKKMFNCFSCGEKGNVITFYQKYYNIPYGEAVLRLAKKLNIDVDVSLLRASNQNDKYYKIMEEASKFYSFYLNNSTFSEKALDYLNKRGIDEDIINEFKIGLAPDGMDDLYQTLCKDKIQELDQIELGLVNLNNKSKPYDVFRNRIMFPIWDEFDKIIGFSGRIYSDSNEPKYVNSKETKIFHKGNVLYNFSRAQKLAREGEPIFVLEGFMDVIAAFKANVKTGVASMGTAFTDEHAKKILNVTNNIVLCFDGDEAGIKALHKTVKVFSHFNFIPDAIIIPNNMDPDEYLQKFGKDALKDLFLNHHANAFEVMYGFSKQNLDKNSIISIEKYKIQVFTFLEDVKQETLVSFYLKKVSEELGLELNKIINDFNNFVGTKQSRKLEEINYNKPSYEVKKEKKKSIVVEKHYRAMELIIGEMLKDKHRFELYREQMGDNYFDIVPELNSKYMSIILEIETFYNAKTSLEERKYSVSNPSQLFSDEKSYDYILLKKIMESPFYHMVISEKDFLINIEELLKLITKIKNKLLLEKINGKNKVEQTEKFIEAKAKTIVIEKKARKD